MTTPIPPTSTPIDQVLGQPATTAATSAAGSSPGGQLDQDTFLKLLVAQMKYQDPMNPTDGTQFIAQTAQLTQVQTLQSLESTTTDLLSAQQLLNASALIGKTVTYTGPGGSVVTGVVTSAHFGGSTPTLRVGDTDVPLPSVTEVQSTAG